MLKVITEDTTGKIIRNEACISEDSDKDEIGRASCRERV